MIEAWLQTHLETIGRANTDGISRRARTTFCRTCGQPTIRGLDDDKAALPATCDPQPLGPAAEALALITGCRSYELAWRGDHYELDHRDRYRITGKPAGTGIHAVAEHKCGQPLPAIDPPPDIPTRTFAEEAPDEPPF